MSGDRTGAGSGTATLSSPPGLTLRVRRVPGPPVVGVRAWMPGGARIEEVPGQALVTGRSLTEGTARRDWREVADATEALGVAASGSASFEVHGAAVDVRSAHWREGLDWAVELVTEPAFPEDRCRWMARQAASELESLRDQPEVRTAWSFLEHLYAPHPRSRPLHGDRESLDRLTAEDCRRFHERSLAGRGLTVTVAGDLDEDAVRHRLSELLAGEERLRSSAPGRSRGRPGEVPDPEAPVGLPERRRIVDLPRGDQAHWFAGSLTVRRDAPDRHALELLGVVLGAGAGLTGRLPERVREREGLAYAVHVQTLAGSGLDPGRLMVYVGTSPATVERAEAAVVEELERLVEEGVGAEELEQARSYLLGRDPFRRETARQWADLMGEAVLYGVPEDDPGWRIERLKAVGPEEATAAARRHLDPERLKVTVGLPRR